MLVVWLFSSLLVESQELSRTLLLRCYWSLQITWLEGHSLAQTVFTCLYVHNPDLIQDSAMKAFALGILKVCDIAREKVNKAAVFEEVYPERILAPSFLIPLLRPPACSGTTDAKPLPSPAASYIPSLTSASCSPCLYVTSVLVSLY